MALECGDCGERITRKGSRENPEFNLPDERLCDSCYESAIESVRDEADAELERIQEERYAAPARLTAREALEELAAHPNWTLIWQLMNAFAKGDTQKQYARVEPLAVLSEVYLLLAEIDSKRRDALSLTK